MGAIRKGSFHCSKYPQRSVSTGLDTAGNSVSPLFAIRAVSTGVPRFAEPTSLGSDEPFTMRVRVIKEVYL